MRQNNMDMRAYLLDLATDRRRGVIPGAFKALLWNLSVLYGVIVRVLSFIESARAVRLPCKVISIGNITLGGTGKTSLVEYIAGYLTGQGHKVAVVSRGYKRKNCKPGALRPGYQEMGDEPFMLQGKLKGVPVVVDADRIRGARRAIKEYGVEAVILDDAFQQWKIKKDLEVVAIDAANAFGNRQMLPRGILRQPLSALGRADVLVLTKVNLVEDAALVKAQLAECNPHALVVFAAHVPVDFFEQGIQASIPLAQLKGARVALVSGIGSPDSFEALIVSLGMSVAVHMRFGDHHRYQAKDIDEIRRVCSAHMVETLVTTEKDAVRLQAPGGPVRMLVLRIRLELTHEAKGFTDRLAGLFSA